MGGSDYRTVAASIHSTIFGTATSEAGAVAGAKNTELQRKILTAALPLGSRKQYEI